LVSSRELRVLATEKETRMSDRDIAAVRSILFEPIESDIIYNLEGALYDLEHQFDPGDGGVCAHTIRRALVQLEIARKLMGASDAAEGRADD
jgi:hypothetical protein